MSVHYSLISIVLDVTPAVLEIVTISLLAIEIRRRRVAKSPVSRLVVAACCSVLAFAWAVVVPMFFLKIT